jgi:bacterial/archaeal transporter family protein
MSTWIVLGLLSAGFAALVAIFGKIGIKDVDSTLATAVRAVVMAVFLVGVGLIMGKHKLLSTLQSRPLLFIILSGVAGAMSWLCYFLALRTGPVAGVAALDRLSVVFVVILAALFLAEPFTWKTGTAAVLISVGAFLMVWK